METDVNTNQNQSTIPLERAIVTIEGERAKEVTAHSAADDYNNKGRPRKIVHVFKEPAFGVFHLMETDRGWWKDTGKVQKLIDAFKQRHMVKTALVYAGISGDEWFQFSQVHPDFARVKQACEENKTLRYMNTVEEIFSDKTMAPELRAKLGIEYLRGVHPDYNKKIKVELDQPLKPSTVHNNVAIIGTDNAKVADAITELTRKLIHERRAEIERSSGGGSPVEDTGQGGGA